MTERNRIIEATEHDARRALVDRRREPRERIADLEREKEAFEETERAYQGTIRRDGEHIGELERRLQRIADIMEGCGENFPVILEHDNKAWAYEIYRLAKGL